VSASPGPAVAVVTADCVPLLIAAADGSVVAAVHAGWRGIAAGVVERALEAIRGAGATAPLVAALGPAASGCCYEVGPEVAAALGLASARDAAVTDGPRGRPMLDLRTAVRNRLIDAGIDPRLVDRVGPCTICSTGWPSWRREREHAERQVAWIAPGRG
jgi:YfiH family protein